MSWFEFFELKIRKESIKIKKIQRYETIDAVHVWDKKGRKTLLLKKDFLPTQWQKLKIGATVTVTIKEIILSQSIH